MNKKNIFIITAGIILLFSFIVGLSLFYSPEEEPSVNEEKELPIGGKRDEHGCLAPAGYSWNSEANACIREWELDKNQIKAVKIAVDYVGYEKGLTITQVQTARCPGCFMVEVEKGKNRVKVTLEDYKAVKKTLTPDECIAKGGETVNITGGAKCDDNQLNIGDVTSFISPHICCVPKETISAE